MDLVTPDSGLFFWMVVIFGLLFFILAKFGFPTITKAVEKRDEAIARSLLEAKEVEEKMSEMVKEHERMIAETRKEQALILKEATRERSSMISRAKEEAREEADRILSEAREQIATEKESAMRDIRREVALLSVAVAGKILRSELSDEERESAFLSKMVDETMKIDSNIS